MNEDQNGLCDEFEQQLFYGYCKSQVTQYNEILMDPDDFRRYERLDSIKDKFIAYPPFWYFFFEKIISCAMYYIALKKDIDENGVIIQALDKVKAADNPQDMLELISDQH